MTVPRAPIERLNQQALGQQGAAVYNWNRWFECNSLYLPYEGSLYIDDGTLIRASLYERPRIIERDPDKFSATKDEFYRTKTLLKDERDRARDNLKVACALNHDLRVGQAPEAVVKALLRINERGHIPTIVSLHAVYAYALSIPATLSLRLRQQLELIAPGDDPDHRLILLAHNSREMEAYLQGLPHQQPTQQTEYVATAFGISVRLHTLSVDVLRPQACRAESDLSSVHNDRLRWTARLAMASVRLPEPCPPPEDNELLRRLNAMRQAPSHSPDRNYPVIATTGETAIARTISPDALLEVYRQLAKDDRRLARQFQGLCAVIQAMGDIGLRSKSQPTPRFPYFTGQSPNASAFTSGTAANKLDAAPNARPGRGTMPRSPMSSTTVATERGRVS